MKMLFLLFFLISAVSVHLLKKLAYKHQWVVQPRSDRFHEQPTALHGGVAFMPPFIVGVAVLLFNQLPEDPVHWIEFIAADPAMLESIAMLVGAIIMFFVGWFDDLFELSPSSKLFWQLLAASIFILSGGAMPFTEIMLVNGVLTLVWVVGVVNSINLIDNMDGLSAGVVLITILFVLLLLFQSPSAPQLLAIPMAMMFLGVVLGFLVFNYPSASIFMGDSGSLSLGYVLAVITVPSELNGMLGVDTSLNQLGVSFPALLIPVALLCVPILDTALVTFTRILRGSKVTKGGKDHSSHRMLMLGYSQQSVLWTFYSLACLGGVVAILIQMTSDNVSVLIFFVFTCLLTWVGYYLGRIKI